MKFVALSLAMVWVSWAQAPSERRYMFNNLTVSPVGDLRKVHFNRSRNFLTWSPDSRQVAFSMAGSIWQLTLGISKPALPAP